MCNCGKTTYKSRTDANEHNQYVGRNLGIWHDAYKCKLCGYWHLASRGKKIKLSVY